MVVINYFLILLNLIQVILLAYCGLGALYVFIFSLAGLTGKKRQPRSAASMARFAVLIPGYKEDNVIVDAAAEALKQDYPADLFDVIVIADSFQKTTLDQLHELNIRVIEVSFEHSTKAKALNRALSVLPDNRYDVALVLDADNIMENSFLKKLNAAFSCGIQAVQGHRIAKNTNTSFAILDAISEEINNHIFRKGHRALGLSASLIGSGMAFRYPYFKNMMLNIRAVGGFDKEIELTMLRERQTIGYLEDAVIFDEKVQASEVFVKQRRRWLSAQIHYARYFTDALKELLRKGNADYFDKALQMLLPPRIILLGTVFTFTLISPLFNPPAFSIAWLLLFSLTILSLLFAVPGKFYHSSTLKALLALPRGFFLMMVSLFSTRGANKRFIHTNHTTSSISTK